MIGEDGVGIKGCRLKNASAQNIRSITSANLRALERMIEYNAENQIRLFRISSDIVPFASHPAVHFDWKREFAEPLLSIGEKIKKAGIRVSMHPGQYTVLNSPDERVAANALLDLAYHADFLQALGMTPESKVVLHTGGAYGDKKKAMSAFIRRAKELPEAVCSRIALENDDKVFTVQDVLELSAHTGFPVIFDNLHHALCPPKETLSETAWIKTCAATWGKEDGRPKLHYSQPGGRRGAHSKTIDAARFLAFYQSIRELEVDIMLEVKDKNLSTVKCMKAVLGRVPTAELEREWARYKYMVLSRSQTCYNELRAFLKDKGTADAVAFYERIDAALALAGTDGTKKNAARHVWGYLKDKASAREKKQFSTLTESEGMDEAAVKRFLRRCLDRYEDGYLKRSYYFYLD